MYGVCYHGDMVGERLRQARVARQLSLADVASQANVSAATLSRVERDKQAIDITLFLTLARVLNATPADLLDDGGGDTDESMAARIATMQSRDRTKLWRQISEERNGRRERQRGDVRTVAGDVEELLAQMDFLREEIRSVSARLNGKKR